MGGGRLQLSAEAEEECRARIAGTVQGVTDARGDRREQDCRGIPAWHVPDSSTISFYSVESK